MVFPTFHKRLLNTGTALACSNLWSIKHNSPDAQKTSGEF